MDTDTGIERRYLATSSDSEDDLELLRRIHGKNPEVPICIPALSDQGDDEDDFEMLRRIQNLLGEEEHHDGKKEIANSDAEILKKKKRKKRESEKRYELDDDDYELLRDNNVTGFCRQKPESKTSKRLRKAQRDSEGEHSGFTGPLLDDIAEEEEQPEEGEDGNLGVEDEMADFIVSEENDDGVLGRRKKAKKESRAQQQDFHAIFGDSDKQAKMGERDNSAECTKKRLEDVYEPIVLSQKYMTDKDILIREIDLPERLQIAREASGAALAEEMIIDEEVDWVYNQLMTHQGMRELLINKEDIKQFLELMHVEKFDVPFIAMYRKDKCLSLFEDPDQHEADIGNQNKADQKCAVRWHKVLWDIMNLDIKWLLLQNGKIARLLHHKQQFEEESRKVYHVARLSLDEQLMESFTKSLMAAESEREFNDVDLKFNLHFPAREFGVDKECKRAKRKSDFSDCREAGLWLFAKKFGSSEQFGLQISLKKMAVDKVEDPKESPEVMAFDFICEMFETSQAVLKGARHMAAIEMSSEPCVRNHVRRIFMDNAVVSTTPTIEGRAAIDTYHQFAGVKCLWDKPLTRFEDAQWLLIQKAVEQKLLKVTVKLPDSVSDNLIADSSCYYLSDGVSNSAHLWNEQRKMILEDAFFSHLLPSIENQARCLLTSRAKNWLLMEYGKLFWDKVSMAPYKQKENSDAAPRVMACCWGPGKPATTFVMLDSSGEVVDVLDAEYLSGDRLQNINNKQHNKDRQCIVKFMTDHKPHVVVLGAVNLSCPPLKDYINKIISEIVAHKLRKKKDKKVADKPRDVGHEMDGLSVIYGDESLPRIYATSLISSDQLPEHSDIVRRAVALGRYEQNSLAMVATLCGPDREILSWQLSPLQNFLSDDEMYGMVEQVMVDVTNQVGLDVNMSIAHNWLFSPLQFISGLGPRKAISLKRSLLSAKAIYSREDLLTAHGLGKKVYENSVGFLCIRHTGLAASSSRRIDWLDGTRIHPESYHRCKESKDIFLADDKGFQDWRRQYVKRSQKEEFYLISRETEDTLAIGRIVYAKVLWVRNRRASCALDSGLIGTLNIKYGTTDNWKLRKGEIITCMIKSIEINMLRGFNYKVLLTWGENKMWGDHCKNHRTMEPFYHEGEGSSQSDKDNAHKERKCGKRNFQPTMIVHPGFQNIQTKQWRGRYRAHKRNRGLDPYVQKIREKKYGWKYGCGAKGCTKLFHAAEFVHKRLKLKHPELVMELTSKVREDLDFQNYMKDADAPGGTPVMQPSIPKEKPLRRRPGLDSRLKDDCGSRKDCDNRDNGNGIHVAPPFSSDITPPVLMPVPGTGPLGPFVPAPPEVAMQMLREQGGPSPFEGGGRNRRSGPQLSGPDPIIALPQAFRQYPRHFRSYQDLDAPEDEVTVIDYRSL